MNLSVKLPAKLQSMMRVLSLRYSLIMARTMPEELSQIMFYQAGN
jgi:hypothetical protein